MRNKGVKLLTTAGIIAAAYIALTLLLAPISFGVVQCRISEALCVLPMITPAAIPGLFVGCLVANIYTGNLIDIIFGSLTTLVAAFLTYKTKTKTILAPLFPVVLNAVVVGGYLAYFIPELSPLLSMSSIGAGEAIACYGAGLPLYFLLRKTKLFK